MSISLYISLSLYIYLYREREREKERETYTLLVKCPSVQWQPDGLTIHTNKWFLGAGFLGAPPISLIRSLLMFSLCKN